ncbi:unnamed protein product [Protopolystoma xenopodis]|uniref:Secreted protein n=1 Tax=Protopolystoma xenopodis TaxID=117903 RepID=A0A3S5AD60_9PLAT|nr:unnamed protein product [Protopolystoma xenopodis]
MGIFVSTWAIACFGLSYPVWGSSSAEGKRKSELCLSGPVRPGTRCSEMWRRIRSSLHFTVSSLPNGEMEKSAKTDAPLQQSGS